MRVDSIKKHNKTDFQGRVQLPSERFFTKIIDGMDFFEKQKVVKRLIKEEKRNNPTEKMNLIQKIINIFSFNKKDSKNVVPEKTLKDFWKESLSEMKKLVKEKLSDDYALNCKKSNLGKEYIEFHITKGEEYICSVSANITNPKLPKNRIKEAVEIISNPEYEKQFNGFKEIIPDLTENKFVMNNQNFMKPKMLKWLDVNEKLKHELTHKRFKFSLQLKDEKNGHYETVVARIIDKNDEEIFNGEYYVKGLEGIPELGVNYISNQISKVIKRANDFI